MRLQIEVLMLALAMLIGAAGGWYVEHLRFTVLQEKVKAEAEKQQIKTDQTTKLQTIVTQDTSKEYEAKIAAIKRYYADRMRNNSSSCEVSIVPSTASGVNEETSDRLPAAQVIEQCAETTQQLKSLQDWITKQQEINK